MPSFDINKIDTNKPKDCINKIAQNYQRLWKIYLGNSNRGAWIDGKHKENF